MNKQKVRPNRTPKAVCYDCGKPIKSHPFEIFLEDQGTLLRFHVPCLARWAGAEPELVSDLREVFK